MATKTRGFTLYELLITVTLIALISGLAIPSFAANLARQRQRVEIDALFHAIHLARKESIMRRKVVSLCPSLDGQSCSGSRDWSSGWLMFENSDRDSPPSVDANEPVLVSHRVDDAVVISANRKGFTLRATFLRATNGTFVFCDPKDRIKPRALVISYTGRPRVAVLTTDGELYSCAD
ncbi:MAG: prepilin-type N-terminal cleavage/methylation domain-containing protein [Gammaproteobacteria bacterium]|nr:prepilin-type N-terminal cleavage/methylation domain-containing protein [Gammaproteobacteria bacterium]